MTDRARDVATELTGRRAVRASQLGAALFEVELADGAVVVVKAGAGAGASAAEAASLRWLAEPSGPPVPAVHGQDDDWLVMERVASGAPSVRTAEELGRGLATLHDSGAPAFGAAPPDGKADAWIGLAPMRNETRESWPDFYASQRVEPYLRRAIDQGTFDSGQARVLTEVCERLDELAGPEESPARLHGDLWSGNVHWAADGRAWLIDPAAHGGHRETDLAMLHLFGCPQLDRMVDAYQDVTPLASGWRDRIPLHQLFPLLVHTVLFGGGYARQTIAAARSAPTSS
ncbi:MAG: phosphotransferase [Pseudonocardiaceae bacterium]|nr:phosphotransferase [Pseudonocardiaceae bacterium]